VTTLLETRLDTTRFLELLGRLIAVTEQLQNAADAGLVPRESLAAELVCGHLSEALERGRLRLQTVVSPQHPERPSLVLTVPGRSERAVSFVGAHFDVVPADAEGEGWRTDPFRLTEERDLLFGRGTTDCLGHVALLTELVRVLALHPKPPERTVHVVFIANEEESPIPGIGFESVVEEGLLAPPPQGPVYWLDSADFGPTVGTGGIAKWTLSVTGAPGHSGMPQNCINALQCAMVVALRLAQWFETRCPRHPEQHRYGFLSDSSLKPTMLSVDNTKVTKIPGRAVVGGDMRLVPFYDVATVADEACAFVASLDAAIARGETPSGFPRVRLEDGRRAELSLSIEGRPIPGVACRLDSPGYLALTRAIREVRGETGLRPFSMTGSLPMVAELARRGYDVQITGFGESAAYHAPNEWARLSDMVDGYAVLMRLVECD